MNTHKITVDKEALKKEIIVENIIREIRYLPWLWGQFLKIKDDNSYATWVSWFKESMPKTTNSFLNDILNMDM